MPSLSAPAFFNGAEQVACLFFAQKAERNLIKRLKSSLKFGLQIDHIARLSMSCSPCKP
jgi:hypothetical protein